jgi:transcriptional regulator NrdR family protein
MSDDSILKRSLADLTILQLQQALQDSDKAALMSWASIYGDVKDLDSLYTTVIDLLARRKLREEIVATLTEKISELDRM